MAIHLGNVNISIAQFQAISSGTHNAGEVTLKDNHTLGKVNHHVGILSGRNTVAISHAEVMAVKRAFVGALGAGGVSEAELGRVRAELGLDAGGPAANQSLRARSIKPLTRQLVREILDRYADTLNAHDGQGTIRTAAQMEAGLSPEEIATRRQRREAANGAIAANRAALDLNRDIDLFTRLVAGDFAGISHDDANRMVEMAQAKIAAARAKYPDVPLPANDAKTLVVQWELEGGQKIDFSAHASTAAFVAKMEDAIFVLKHSSTAGDGKLTGVVPPDRRNDAIRLSLVDYNRTECFPHDVRVMVEDVIAAARAKFGPVIVPPGLRFSDIDSRNSVHEFIQNFGNATPLGVDHLRPVLEEALLRTCVQRGIEGMLKAESERQGVAIRFSLSIKFLARAPHIVDTVRSAASAQDVTAAFAAFREEVGRFVTIAASAYHCAQTFVFEVAADELAEKTGLPRSSLRNQIGQWADLAAAAQKLVGKIVSGEVEAANTADIEKLFRDKARELVKRRTDALALIDSYTELLPEVADRLKAEVVQSKTFDKRRCDLEKFRAIAHKPEFEVAISAFKYAMSAHDLSMEAGYAALRNFHDTVLEILETNVGKYYLGFEDKARAFQTIMRLAFNGNSEPLRPAKDFFARADVQDDIYRRPGEFSFRTLIMAFDMPVDGLENNDIVEALDSGKLPPHHAKALADAARDMGLTGLSADDAVLMFSTKLPAGESLAEAIRNMPVDVTPRMMNSLACGVLRGFADMIADGTAAIKLFLPADAREIAGRAYQKAGDDPAKADKLVAAAFAACGADAELRRIVCGNLDQILAGPVALRTEAKVREHIEGLKANIAELRESAPYLVGATPEEMLRVGYDFLANVNTVFPRGTLTRLFQTLSKLPMDALTNLKARSGVRDVHQALVQVQDNIKRVLDSFGNGLNGPEQQAACRHLVQRFMAMRCRLSMTDQNFEAIHNAIRSQNAAKLVAGYGKLREFAQGKEDGNFSARLLDGIDHEGQLLAPLVGELNAQLCLERGLELQQNAVPQVAPEAIQPEDYDAEGLLADVVPYVLGNLEAANQG